MDGPTVAIIVSFLSFGVSAFALGWNVYRDVYLKAKLQLSFGLLIVQPDSTFPKPMWRYALFATNLGPGKIKLTQVYRRRRDYSIWKRIWQRITRRVRYGLVIHDRLPCALDMGETMDFSFAPEDCKWLARGDQIGIADSFGRIHWCNKKYMTKATREFEEKAWQREIRLPKQEKVK